MRMTIHYLHLQLAADLADFPKCIWSIGKLWRVDSLVTEVEKPQELMSTMLPNPSQANTTQRRIMGPVFTINFVVGVEHVIYCSQSSNEQAQYILYSLYRPLPALDRNLIRCRTEHIYLTLASSLMNPFFNAKQSADLGFSSAIYMICLWPTNPFDSW